MPYAGNKPLSRGGAEKTSWLQRWMGACMARDLRVLAVPGLDVARAYGLDLAAAGLRIAATPRHADVLLLAGPLSPALRSAAVILYAQMMRPRAILALGCDDHDPLPAPDVSIDLSQSALVDGVAQLRTAYALSAFPSGATDFTAAMLQARIEYTCSMHPEVVEAAPGSCPKCGMDLIPREGSAPNDATAHDHGQHDEKGAQKTHGKPGGDDSDHAAMDHGKQTPGGENVHAGMSHGKTGKDHAHPADVEQRKNPSDHKAPEAPTEEDHRAGKHTDKSSGHNQHDDATHDDDQDDQHGEMNHDEMGFMSMVEVTKDLPRSPDGLQMDWIDVPFGPVFPGLPGGLQLTLTLDGDTVAKADAAGSVSDDALLDAEGMEASQFIARLEAMDPLAPIAYRLLACQALEAASGRTLDDTTRRSRVAVLERERIASHLNWLALFGCQIGLGWLEHRAAQLQYACLGADIPQLERLALPLHALTQRVIQTPLMTSRLAGIGRMTATPDLRGPVARAAGMDADARANDPAYAALSFTRAHRQGGDALGRLRIRLDEIIHSLALIQRSGTLEPPESPAPFLGSGDGSASLETPRGEARLSLTLDQGRVTRAALDAPSAQLLGLLPDLLAQQELGDALTIVCSLDLSPWEVTP